MASQVVQAVLQSGLHFGALVIAILLASGAAYAQDATGGFNPGNNGEILAIAVQSDGKIVVGGYFNKLGGGGLGTTTRSHIGRLNSDGSIDPTFTLSANNSVSVITIQPNGQILVAGSFSTLTDGSATYPRAGVARLNPDGSVDASFNPGANSYIHGMAVDPNGRIVVIGTFTMIGGGATGTQVRNRIARLNADGSLDAGFDPGADGSVGALAIQSDGRIIVGGFFTALGGRTGTTPRRYIGRLAADGSVDPSFNPDADGPVYALKIQPDGQILVGGSFLGFGSGAFRANRARIARFARDGRLDSTFNPGASNWVSNIGLQTDGKIVVAGEFQSLGNSPNERATRRIGRINPDGTIDVGFAATEPDHYVYTLAMQPDQRILVGGFFHRFTAPGIGRERIARLNTDGSVDAEFRPGASDAVVSIALQPDGKAIVGGHFLALGGGGAVSERRYIGRFFQDGSLDLTFNPGADHAVFATTVQPDGQILVGGAFTKLGGGTGTTSRRYLGRLTADGLVDPAFDPGANEQVLAIARQPDGKILIAGVFTSVGGGGTGSTGRNRIARLNADGSVDADFNPGANGIVHTIVPQPDGKILVAGEFTALGGGTGTTARAFIGRLNADGSLDTAFDPGANTIVNSLVLQPDGKILVAGYFTRLGGGGTGSTSRSCIGRLNEDGSLDTAFDPGSNNFVNAMALQRDGKVLVGGAFTMLGGGGTGSTSRNRIGRINSDGTLDLTFDPGANGFEVRGLAIQSDGRILVGGDFTALGGGDTGTASRNRIGRLTNTAPTLDVLTISESAVTWSLQGPGPELMRVTFEGSSNGTDYTPLGDGTRVSGGWQLADQRFPSATDLFVRARGYYRTGQSLASDSVLESVAVRYWNPYGAYAFTDDPLVPGVTGIKAAHLSQLQGRINAVRVAHGLSAYSWTDAVISSTTAIRAIHIAELRAALSEVYTTLGLNAPTFTDPIVAGSTHVKAIHITELRAALVAIE